MRRESKKISALVAATASAVGDLFAIVQSGVTKQIAIANISGPFDQIKTPEIKTDASAATDLTITTGSQKTIALATPVYDDLRVPVTSIKTGGVKDPTFSQYLDNGAGSRGVYGWSFADQGVAGNEEELFFSVQLPHSYKHGTDITPHVHWSVLVGGAANEFVKWGLEYTWANIDGTFGSTTIITSDASSAANATTSGDTTLSVGKHYVSELSGITGTSKTISSMLVCRIFRNSSDSDDDLAQAAFAHEVDFHFQIDTIGSRQELVK